MVLNRGRITYFGTSVALLADPAALNHHLGVADDPRRASR
jgi:hypothetical protein